MILPTVLDETDLALLHALQIAPRAPWAALTQTLDISAATAARRWQRLTTRGDAWITAYALDPALTGYALIEVDCDASRTHEVAEAIGAHPHAVTVEETTGSHGLLLTVFTPSMNALSRYLTLLQQVPGVRSVGSHVVTRLFSDASQWRLDALAPGQQRALRALGDERPARSSRFTTLDRSIAVLLSQDGRMPLSELSDRLHVSVNTVSRRLGRLIGSSALCLRCEVARPVSGHEVAAIFWLDVPPQALKESARALAPLPQSRLVVSVTGPQNLAVMAWLRHPGDIPDFESELAHRAPRARVVDRAVTLCVVKHLGRLFDEEGRARGIVPLDPWAGPQPKC
jgi:DNA-binding Lrp family transcriptional regulator